MAEQNQDGKRLPIKRVKYIVFKRILITGARALFVGSSLPRGAIRGAIRGGRGLLAFKHCKID